MFTFSILLVTLTTAAIPLIIKRLVHIFPKLPLHPSHWWLPPLAAVCFFVAFYLPDINISSETSSFQQHFLGGGVFTALLFIYTAKLLNWKLHWAVVPLALFAWVSAFGVASELLEFTLSHLAIMTIDTSDTDWDLVANTSGAAVTYLVYLTVRSLRR